MLRQSIKKLAGPKLSNIRFMFAAPLAYAPGHFYSPICDQEELRHRYRDPKGSNPPATVLGIELSHENQVGLWESDFLPSLPSIRLRFVANPSKRYNLSSSSYGIGDAMIYAGMLMYAKPSRLIEVGVGSSSAVALDTFETFFERQPDVTLIDPYPDCLDSVLRQSDRDRVKVIRASVQDVPLETFRSLEKDDILFIDSTHIVKTGSDVLYELFEILPRLRSGMIVHFHDIFYPFEYPRNWVLDNNYSWNELYVLRAFLTGNRDWEILFFNDYFAQAENARMKSEAPDMLVNPGGGLWLRRR